MCISNIQITFFWLIVPPCKVLARALFNIFEILIMGFAIEFIVFDISCFVVAGDFFLILVNEADKWDWFFFLFVLENVILRIIRVEIFFLNFLPD